MTSLVRGLLIAVLLAAICLSPAAASAQTQNDPSAVLPLTAEQARAAFMDKGFAADSVVDWGWTIPSLRSFVVHDVPTQRVLMVMVFPSSQEAGVFKGRLVLQQASAASNPYVLAGYGRGVWNGNVVIMQSTESQLERVAQLQADQDNGINGDPNLVLDARAPEIAVDLDFQLALLDSVVNV
jgi:hypothetical protein